MKRLYWLIPTALLLTACDRESAPEAFTPEMASFSNEFEFDPLRGPVKDFSQTLLDEHDVVVKKVSAQLSKEGCFDLLTLEDEDGKEVTFEVIDATEVNGTRYLAVIPYQEDPESLQEDAELILMRIGTDDEGEYMDIVDDDEELITVGKVFEERLRAMYDIDDSELQ